MLLGLAGLFVISKLLWLGVFMVLLGVVVPIVALWLSRQAASSAPGPAIHKERKAAPTISAPHRNVDRNKLGVLRYTLHQANLDSNAPVFETGDHKIITVRDILVEMIDIAEAHDRPIGALAKDIVAMYPRIFENAKLALRQYPDEELAKTYIARKAMTDIQGKLE
jgi:hypothetical protein